MLKSERETSERLRSQVGFLSEQVNQLSRYNLELSEARVSEANQWRIEMGRMMANYKSKNSSELTKTQAELQVALSTIQQLRQQLSMLESRNVEYLTQLRRQQELFTLQNQELFATIQDLDHSNF